MMQVSKEEAWAQRGKKRRGKMKRDFFFMEAQVVISGILRLISFHITVRKRDYKLHPVEGIMCSKVEKRFFSLI
jgi:hypothetical protein